MSLYLQWWVYVIIVIIIFLVCLLTHYLVKKRNDVRFEERLNRLYGKQSATTQVAKPLLDMEDKKHGGKLPKEGTETVEGISLIFSKEQNKTQTNLKHKSIEESWTKYLFNKGIKFSSSDNIDKKLRQYDTVTNNSSVTITCLQDDIKVKSAPTSSQTLKASLIDSPVTDTALSEKINTVLSEKGNLNNINFDKDGKQDVKMDDDKESYSNFLGAIYFGKHRTKGSVYSVENKSSKANTTKNTAKDKLTGNFSIISGGPSSEYSTEKPKTSKHRTLYDITRSKDSIKKTVSKVTFKHETMIPNVEKIAKEINILKDKTVHDNISDALRSRESIRKQASKVTFIDETKTPNKKSDSTSDLTDTTMTTFDVSKIATDSSTKLSEKTYSRESVRKISSKVTFVDEVFTISTDFSTDLNTEQSEDESDIKLFNIAKQIKALPATKFKYQDEESSKSLFDQMEVYKDKLAQELSLFTKEEASTSTNDYYLNNRAGIVFKTNPKGDMESERKLGSTASERNINGRSIDEGEEESFRQLVSLDRVYCSPKESSSDKEDLEDAENQTKYDDLKDNDNKNENH